MNARLTGLTVRESKVSVLLHIGTAAAATAVSAAPSQPGTQPVHYGKPALPWANFSSSPLSAGSNMALGNVFPPTTASNVSGSHLGFGFGSHPNPMGVATTLSTSQSLDLSPKTWATSAGMNPFMVMST